MGYQSSYNKVPGHKFGAQSSKLGCIRKLRKQSGKIFLKKEFRKKKIFGFLFFIPKRVKSPGSKAFGSFILIVKVYSVSI